MLTNVSLPADAFSLDGIRAVLALEGHTLTLSAPMTLEQSSGSLTIRDSTSSGKITGQALTVKGGRLTVEAGCFENTLNLQASSAAPSPALRRRMPHIPVRLCPSALPISRRTAS